MCIRDRYIQGARIEVVRDSIQLIVEGHAVFQHVGHFASFAAQLKAVVAVAVSHAILDDGPSVRAVLKRVI